MKICLRICFVWRLQTIDVSDLLLVDKWKVLMCPPAVLYTVGGRLNDPRLYKALKVSLLV